MSPSSKIYPSTSNSYITSYHLDNEGNGSLHITYSDGTYVSLPKEKGRFDDGKHIMTQETFSDIQIADDRQHIGWLADYMICAQSYPCAAELVIYRSGQKLRHISSPYGIFWRWKFLKSGKQVVVQFGFPHGDDVGEHALYEAETGRELSRFSFEEGEAPSWVLQLSRSKR